MKKIGLNIIIGLLTIASLNAQETLSDKEESLLMPKHIVKVFPLDLLYGGVAVGYERVIKPKTSLNFELFQGFGKPEFKNSISEKSYRLYFETSVRRYISKQKKAPEGWFLSGGLITQYDYDKLKNKTSSLITNRERLRFGASGRTGYQWLFKKGLKGFTAEVIGGFDFRTVSDLFDGGGSTGYNITLNATIGYSW